MELRDATRAVYRVEPEAARADDDVPPGYKRTEVGVIPEDWDVVAAGSLGKFRGGNGFPLAYQGKIVGDYPFFKVSDMNNKGNEIEMLVANNYISDAVRKRLGAHAFPATTIIFAKVGAAVFLERKKLLAIPSCIDNNMAGFTITDEGCAFQYVLYYFLSFSLGSLVSMTALPSLSGGVLNRIQIPIPPTLAEQQAIAEALTDADALIESLQQLIAKQRAIKQGAMQALLTGRQRLPGFTGEWQSKLLGDVSHIKTGSRNNEDKVNDGIYPFFVRSEHVERINSFSYDCEAILVPGEGRIGDIFHYIVGRFDVHQRVYSVTQFDSNVCGKFVYYYMMMYFGPHALQNTVKATVDSLRLPTFQEFEMRIPPTLAEQTAIATILSDMDAGIEALEARLAKTRALKAGMMQQLLTGRIRLV